MSATKAYRFTIAAAVFSIVIHAIALLAMVGLLDPGLRFADEPLERATYVAEHVTLWRIGWFTWQLTAVSDLLLSAGLLAMAWTLQHSERFRWAAIVSGLFCVTATIVAVIPDQWGEFLLDTAVPHQAAAFMEGRIPASEYITLEARTMMLTGTCGGTGYTLMGIGWMLTTICLGRSRQILFTILGTITWLLFLLAAWFNWQAVSQAQQGYPGFATVFMLNATAFPLLSLWMVWMALLLVAARVERLPAADAELHHLRWPSAGPMSHFAWLVNSLGLRDLMRVCDPILPMPTLCSDVTDVVYLNWLVPAERVAKLLPAPLQLHTFGDQTIMSLLTYRHGHFGPRMFGPLRKLLPSPLQSNWRLYVQPEQPGRPRDGVYFFKTMLSSWPHVLGSRLLTDGLPSQYPLQLEHVRDGERYRTRIDPGIGSSGDLEAVVRMATTKQLPASFAAVFSSWDEAVKYLIEQNRALGVSPAYGSVYESLISIPIDAATILPAEIEGQPTSRYLAPFIAGCEPFAFVVPAVPFQALGQRWCLPLEP